jgi:Uma2 family endonuclease
MTTSVIAPAKSRPLLSQPLVYKESDGKPMAEADKHADMMIYCREALRLHYAAHPDVYVAGNNFVHYQEGNTKAYISPDVYVVFGVDKRQRNSYKVWEEGGHTPVVVFEITSKSTQGEGVGRKRRIYEQVLQVPECFLFDPTGDYLHPRLQGYRLVEERYVPMELENESLHSEVLHLDLVPQGETLWLHDPTTAENLPTLLQEHQARVQAEERAEQEHARAERLAARLRELGLPEEEL